MAHYDCSCCGESMGISHDYCDECKAGRCSRAKPAHPPSYYQAIASNPPMLRVRIVPAGFAARNRSNADETVTDDHPVVSCGDVFVTQRFWDRGGSW